MAIAGEHVVADWAVRNVKCIRRVEQTGGRTPSGNGPQRRCKASYCLIPGRSGLAPRPPRLADSPPGSVDQVQSVSPKVGRERRTFPLEVEERIDAVLHHLHRVPGELVRVVD